MDEEGPILDASTATVDIFIFFDLFFRISFSLRGMKPSTKTVMGNNQDLRLLQLTTNTASNSNTNTNTLCIHMFATYQ